LVNHANGIINANVCGADCKARRIRVKNTSSGGLKMSKKWTTTADFISNGKFQSGAPAGLVLLTEGFVTVGDGSGAKWVSTGNVIAASQTPTLLGVNKLSDARGNEFELIEGQIQEYSGVKHYAGDFGSSGVGAYVFANGVWLPFVVGGAGEVTFISTTTALISGSLGLDVGAIVETTGFTSKGDGGGAKWQKTAETGTPSQTPVDIDGMKLTDALGFVWEVADDFTANPLTIGADKTGSIDSTAHFNIYNRYMTSFRVDETLDYLPKRLVYPAGLFSVSSVDMTDLRGSRNIHIEAFGCVMIANTPGKAVFDMTASRWVWVRGLTVFSPESIVARVGFQHGNKGTETCGNNKLQFCQALGNFSQAAYLNAGSETTQSYSCRWENTSTDDSTYAAIFDGSGVWPYSSDYVTVTKAIDQNVSFSVVKNYGCQFRHNGQGSSLWLSGSVTFSCDDGCYYLAFNKSNLVFYVTSSHRMKDTRIEGSYENTKTAEYGPATNGVQYNLTLAGNGTNSKIDGLLLTIRNPRTYLYPITASNIGTLTINSANIRIIAVSEDDPETLFDPLNCSNIVLNGDLQCGGYLAVNLDKISSYNGTISLSDNATFTGPTTGAYSLINATDNSQSLVRLKSISRGSWVTVTPSGGSITATSSQIVINAPSGSPVSVTDIVNGMAGLGDIYIRVSGGSTATLVHNSAKIRNIGDTNVVLSSNKNVLHYIEVSSGVWAQA
jgi:hypothetical protein